MKSTKTDGCPSEETLCGFADGTLREGRDHVEGHLAECERCLGIVSDLMLSGRRPAEAELVSPPLALERQVQGRPVIEETTGRATSFLRRVTESLFSYRLAGAVATVAVVALVAIWAGQRERYPTEVPSGIRDAGTRGPETPFLIEPRGTIHAGETVVFRWEACPQGERYVITVVDADSGRVVVREAVSPPGYSVPVERLTISGGRHFEWMVQCTIGDGQVAVSPAVPFQLAETPAEE
ncbi:MAG: hypothetical protein KAW17_07235 [Candidatus Eisenbacteria sp.]|nr:hypothetical protein [Candidatus Eisenbacteria bacterium]